MGSDSGQTVGVFSVVDLREEEAQTSLMLTGFIIGLFALGSYWFHADTNQIVGAPLARMVALTNGLAKMFLHGKNSSAKQNYDDDDMDDDDDMLGDVQLDSDMLDETLLVEAVMMKLSSFFEVLPVL